jgi:hypothetical protein
MASAFGGLIAFGILYMDGVAGWAGWRWYVYRMCTPQKSLLTLFRLYIIEGAATILIAFVCYFAIPSSYTTAFFLNDSDKAVMRRRAEITEAYSGGTGRYTRAEFMMAVKDVKTWIHAVVQVMCLTVLYGFSVFLPIILRFGFNYSVRQSQYLSIPVFAWGSIIYGISGYLSDRYARRFLICILSAPIGIVGYAILLGGGAVPVGVKYFACFLIASCAWTLGKLTYILLQSKPKAIRDANIKRRRKSRLVLDQYSAGWEACRQHWSRLGYWQHWRHCQWPDLPADDGSKLHPWSCLEFGGCGHLLLSLVGAAAYLL